MLRSSLLASVAFSPLIMTSALAEEYYDLGEIVLSGSLTPTSIDSTGSTVEVLTGDEIGPASSAILNRLDQLPGVSSSSNGGLGAASSLRIRGLPARYVGVRINGMSVTDSSGTQNQYDFGGLTAAGIGRVEVLKGSQSALYGSEAIGGVVDIQTFLPEKLGFSAEIEAEAGSFGTYSGALNMGHKTESGVVALTYGRIESDGISTLAGDVENEKDGFKQTTVTALMEHAVSDTFTVGGSIYFRDAEMEIDRSVTDNSGINYLEERGAKVFTELQTGAVTHTLSYSHFDVDRRDPGGFTEHFTGKRKQVAYLGSAELGPVYTLNFGIDHTKEEMSTDGVTESNHTNSAQAELLIRPTDTLDISAALRYDDNSDFGGKTTGRLSAVWRPQDDLAFRAVYGTGFRTPSLYERYSDSGDPTLQPEESRSYELGVEKSFGDVGSIMATLFYTEIDDLIDFDSAAVACGGLFGCYNQVPGETKSKGIELSGNYAITGALKIYGNYTYTDAKTDGIRLTRTPRHDFVVGASSDFTDKFSGYVNMRHVAGVVASEYAPAGHKVGDYTLVGMGLSYDITDNATAYLRVENLFDEDYETAGGYNQPGRAAYFGVRANF